MKERSENWISLLLLLHIRSVPAQVPARDASTGRTVIGLPLTGGKDRKPYTGRLGKIVSTRRLKCTFVFTLWASVGLISCGLDLLRNLTDDSHALDFFNVDFGFGLNKLYPLCFPPFFVFHPLFILIPTFPILPFLLIHTSISPPSLSVTQGQRHEESAGFPTEEEWVARKQPSRQDRQIHEICQVSGHFLAARVGVCLCAATFRGRGLTTAHSDLALEVIHQGSDIGGGGLLYCVQKKNVYHWPVRGRDSVIVWIIFEQYFTKSVN